MTDDENLPGDEPPVPPLAGGGADPTLPGGADPTIAQPAQPVEPHYTTGPGMPPERPAGAAGTFAGGGSTGATAAASGPPPWLIPAGIGAIVAVVVLILAFVVLSGDDGDDSIASESSTTLTVPETTVAGGSDTSVPDTATTIVESNSSVPEPTETTVVEGGDTTEPDGDATATTAVSGDTDGGSSGEGDAGGDDGDATDAPCADGYQTVSALPFGLCSQGEVVRNAQFTIALSAAIDVDGFYGPTSFAAVQDIQRGLGLEPDGIVTQELLDVLEGQVPDDEFVVASPGTVRIFDREYPIVRTCRTIPFEGRTADYQVTSYLFRDDFGVQVLDRWSDEGGASGAFFVDDVPVTELSQGFGFEVVEGDSLLQVSVNPTEPAQDTCVGRVTEFDASGEQTRVYSIIDVCAVEGGDRMLLSENAGFTYRADADSGGLLARFDDGLAGGFFFGESTDVGLTSDGSVRVVTTTIDSGGEVRQLRAEYPDVGYPSC